jgi:acyl-CoA thioesterase I
VVLVCALQSTTCGGKAPTQPQPLGAQLRLTCPAQRIVEATRADGAEVRFEQPAPVGGRPPYMVECAPRSGAVLPLGESKVTCSAVDADASRAACEFAIQVRVPRTLLRTRFVAFGDSITYGVFGLNPLILLGPPDTYPFKLEQMLLERYPAQAIVVSNRGWPGERTIQGADRLPGVLNDDRPEVLLLLEGVNMVLELPTERQVAALQRMIVTAQQRRVEVIIATVMAVDPSRRPPGTLEAIRALNARILQLADEYGLGNVVDLFALFSADLRLLAADGLHPTLAGQTRIAEAFRDEVVRRYENRSTLTSRLSDVPR